MLSHKPSVKNIFTNTDFSKLCLEMAEYTECIKQEVANGSNNIAYHMCKQILIGVCDYYDQHSDMPTSNIKFLNAHVDQVIDILLSIVSNDNDLYKESILLFMKIIDCDFYSCTSEQCRVFRGYDERLIDAMP